MSQRCNGTIIVGEKINNISIENSKEDVHNGNRHYFFDFVAID